MLLKSVKPLPVFQITFQTGITRQTVYDILKKLIEKETVGISISDGIKTFFAQAPERLAASLNEKQRLLEDKKQKALSLVPLTAKLSKENVTLPEIQFFEGQKGIRAMFQEMVGSKEKTIRAFSTAKFSEYLGESFRKTILEKRVTGKNFRLNSYCRRCEERSLLYKQKTVQANEKSPF